MLKNPIYTGWRGIDKKRDITAAGKYPTKNGRQGDRRKIPRAPDEVIRDQLIDEPLISRDDFDLVQTILRMKRSFHWRTSENYEQRFTNQRDLDCIGQSRVYTKYR